jgi:hypothetical protein
LISKDLGQFLKKVQNRLVLLGVICDTLRVQLILTKVNEMTVMNCVNLMFPGLVEPATSADLAAMRFSYRINFWEPIEFGTDSAREAYRLAWSLFREYHRPNSDLRAPPARHSDLYQDLI